MTPLQIEALRACAARYIWWETPDEAMGNPTRVVAQVMNLGTWEDVCHLLAVLGKEPFKEVLAHAEPGWLDARSWHYWWHRLGDLDGNTPVPPMPVRTYGAA